MNAEGSRASLHPAAAAVRDDRCEILGGTCLLPGPAPLQRGRTCPRCQCAVHDVCHRLLVGSDEDLPNGFLCGGMKCMNDMTLEERSAQLHFRDAAALKSRTHVACSAPAKSCGAGTNCLAQDGTSKLSGKCPHGVARHFLCMRVPCPEGCGDVHGAAAQGASGACTPHSGVPKEGVKSPGLSAGGDGGQEGLLPAEEPEDGTGRTQEVAPPAICTPVSGAPTKGAPAQDSDSSAGATSRRRSTRTPPRSRGTPTRQPHDDKVVTYAEVKICMKDCVRDLVSSSEFRQWFDEAAVSGVSRINKSKVENLTKTSKEVVDAAKLAGVNLLSTSIQKPLAKHSKEIDGLGKQVKAMEGDVKKMQTSIKDLKAGVTTAVGKAKTSQKGMSETKMLEIVKASDLKRAADLKILIESEVRAIKADLLAAYEEKVARLEAAMKAENAQVLANMANGLHYVVREVVSQVESAGKKRSSTTDLTPSPPSTRRSSSRRKQAPTVDSDQDAEARPGTEEKKPASGASDENAVVMMARSMGMQMVPANSSGYYPPVGASPAQANQVFGGVNAVPLAGGLMSPQGGFIHAFAQPAGGHPFSQAQAGQPSAVHPFVYR